MASRQRWLLLFLLLREFWLRRSVPLRAVAFEAANYCYTFSNTLDGPRRHGMNRHREQHERTSLFGGDGGNSSLPNPSPSAEVVGANGRMGTFYLRHYRREEDPTANNPAAAAVCPRGGVPGTRSPPGVPIYVATPSGAYAEVYDATPPDRRRDLVFVGNPGVPIDDRFRGCTLLVPHFSVLFAHQWRGGGGSDNGGDGINDIQVNTDPNTSPPTYVYGPHAATVAGLLGTNGIAAEAVGSFRQIRAYAGRKLLWASCLWLLCHTHGSSSRPLTVGEVHEVRRDDLERLVNEILPSLRAMLDLPPSGEEATGTARRTKNDDDDDETSRVEGIVRRSDLLGYLEAYSRSISGAVPSVELAKSEFRDRNGVWLQPHRQMQQQQQQQPFHVELLEQMGVDVSAGETGTRC